jgi:polyisoprenyl-teichoic acid--peptidoglycan teichoic acid transferase
VARRGAHAETRAARRAREREERRAERADRRSERRAQHELERDLPPPEIEAPDPARKGGSRTLGALGLLALCVVVAVAAGATAYLLGDREAPEIVATRGVSTAPAAAGQDTLLLVREGAGGPAEGMTLLAAGPGEASGVILFLPVGTLVDIPGVGLDRLGLAHQYGGGALAQATVENLLGVQIDEVAVVTRSGLGSLLGRTGGLTLEVPTRLITRDEDGTAQVRFEPGEQFLDGRRLAEYWGFTSGGEDELASFPRQQAVLGAWLDEAADPDTLAVIAGDGAPQLDTTGDGEWVRDLIAALASARAAGDLQVSLLPVDSFGGDGPDGGATFRVRAGAVEQLVGELLSGSVPADGGGEIIRVQVLNGVGIPGVGQLVDRRLGGGSFRIVLTDNARSFDFAETRILVYDESSRSMDAAVRVQERLGVGTIQVSRQPQSVVDVTVVVGADFIGDDPAGDDATSEMDDDDPSSRQTP